MQYSTLCKSVLLVLLAITCGTFVSALPMAEVIEGTPVSLADITDHEVLLSKGNFGQSPNPTLEKRFFRAPTCQTYQKDLKLYAHQRAVLAQGVPYLKRKDQNGRTRLCKLPNTATCGIFWCTNNKSEKSAIALCHSKRGATLPCPRIAAAAEKLAKTCVNKNKFVLGYLYDTTNYLVSVTGMGCP